MEKRMVLKFAISVVLIYIYSGAFAQRIYLKFNCIENCEIEKEETPSATFKKFDRGQDILFSIGKEDFIYKKNSTQEVKSVSEISFSSMQDLYLFEMKEYKKRIQSLPDTIVFIPFRNNLDSIFVVECVKNNKVLLYPVEWIEKIQ